jgi:hypothetical protein
VQSEPQALLQSSHTADPDITSGRSINRQQPWAHNCKNCKAGRDRGYPALLLLACMAPVRPDKPDQQTNKKQEQAMSIQHSTCIQPLSWSRQQLPVSGSPRHTVVLHQSQQCTTAPLKGPQRVPTYAFFKVHKSLRTQDCKAGRDGCLALLLHGARIDQPSQGSRPTKNQHLVITHV